MFVFSTYEVFPKTRGKMVLKERLGPVWWRDELSHYLCPMWMPVHAAFLIRLPVSGVGEAEDGPSA